MFYCTWWWLIAQAQSCPVDEPLLAARRGRWIYTNNGNGRQIWSPHQSQLCGLLLSLSDALRNEQHVGVSDCPLPREYTAEGFQCHSTRSLRPWWHSHPVYYEEPFRWRHVIVCTQPGTGTCRLFLAQYEGSFPNSVGWGILKDSLLPWFASIHPVFPRRLLENVLQISVPRYVYPIGSLQLWEKNFHSTETTLLKVHSDIALNMDTGNVTALTPLDLSAAFDTIVYSVFLDRPLW